MPALPFRFMLSKNAAKPLNNEIIAGSSELHNNKEALFSSSFLPLP
jgi:hypothetical protein